MWKRSVREETEDWIKERNSIELNSIIIYLSANISAKGPITKLTRVKNKQIKSNRKGK
jgi:hypothetical protein